jgi:hypothetical protein
MSDWWYLVERHDGKQLAATRTRHEAAGVIARSHSNDPDWLTVVPIRPLAFFGWAPRLSADSLDRHPDYPEGVIHG